MRTRIAAFGVVAAAMIALVPPVMAHSQSMPSQPHHGMSPHHGPGHQEPMQPRHHGEGGGHHGQEQQRGSDCPHAGDGCLHDTSSSQPRGTGAGLKI